MQIQINILALKSLSTVEHQKCSAMAMEMVGVMDMVAGVISLIITEVVENQKHPKVGRKYGVRELERRESVKTC